MPSTIIGFVLRSSGRHQAALAILSVLVFLLSAAPLELQRRVINVLVDRGAFETVLWLAAAYVGVVLSEQSLKLCLNVYRGWVAEDSVRRLRSLVGEYADRATRDVGGEEAGVEISMVLEEAEPIGGFTGVSLSEPLLQGGVLASVIVYMLYLDWRMALLGLAFFLRRSSSCRCCSGPSPSVPSHASWSSAASAAGW
jgi:ABC-type multidrug transport system fused ATPase/permease subunit